MQIQNFLIRMMKARRLILAVTALTMALPVGAQNTQIKLPARELSWREVVKSIQEQTPYVIAADKSRNTDALTAKITKSPVAVSSVLDNLLAGTNLTHTLRGNYILIHEKSGSGEDSRVAVVSQHNVPDGNADVPFILGGDMVQVSGSSNAGASNASAPIKTTVYYVPNKPEDHTIRAFSDEPKTEYSFVPSSRMNSRYLPKVAIKTNLLYLATTTPNLAFEFGLARKWTLDVEFGLNPWDLNDDKGGIRHALVQPEVRYWFCNRFEKHFVGLHAIYGKYQIYNIDLKPFGNDLTDKRYDGWGVGGGVSYGFHLPMGKRWAWEFTAGVGYIYLDYDKYRCGSCDLNLGRQTKHYVGPTKVGVSLMFMIK